jgi:2-oxo-4-hydroxy-4-carboxy-5-ureidoimidazoline decarboxylase
MNLDALNAAPADGALFALLRCCGSTRWAERMLARRPFASEQAVLSAADEIWSALEWADWQQAFTAHPRIGDMESLHQKFAATADWCSGEQAGVADAGSDIIRKFADGNREYVAKFGYIFIVCATGKSAPEMLAILQSRLHNDRETELRIAAAEQAKITRLRLEKL